MSEEINKNNQKNFLELKELVKLDLPPPDWIWDGEISEGELNFLAGQAGVAKSLTCHDLITHISKGKDFLGRKTKKGIVILIDEENPKRTLVDRFKRLNRLHQEKEFLHKAFIWTSSGLKIIPTDIRKLEEIIKEHEPMLVIFDSFARFFSGDENSSGDVKFVFSYLKPIMDKYGTTFLFIHHTVKTPKKINIFSLRGSGDIIAACGSVIVINKTKNGFELEQVKNRHGNLSKKIVYTIDDIVTEKGDALRTTVLGEYDSKVNINALVSNWISKNIKKGDCFKSGQIYLGLKSFQESELRKSLSNLASKGTIRAVSRGTWLNPP